MSRLALVTAAFLVTAVLVLNACATASAPPPQPVEGQVLAQGTDKPLPGAVVIARWWGHMPIFPADGQSVCYHVESTTTDEQGRYRFPVFHEAPTHQRILYKRIEIDAYRPGYERAGASAGGKVQYLKPFTGTKGERLEYLSFRMISGTSCNGAAESYKNLYRLRRAVHEEAAALAQTPDERKLADRIKETTDDTLVDRSKPTKYDEQGRLMNVDPKDSFRPEDLE